MENVNLCEEVVKEAERLGLKQAGLEAIRTNPTFVQAYDKNTGFQRSMLTTMLFRMLLSGNFQPPAQIRIALNSANDNNSWLDDIKIVILPFVKANEDSYFPG